MKLKDYDSEFEKKFSDIIDIIIIDSYNIKLCCTIFNSLIYTYRLLKYS